MGRLPAPYYRMALKMPSPRDMFEAFTAVAALPSALIEDRSPCLMEEGMRR